MNRTEQQRALDRLAQWWDQEQDAAELQARTDREQRTTAERVTLGIALAKLRADDTDVGPGGRLAVHFRAQADGLQLRSGTPIVLHTSVDGATVHCQATLWRVRREHVTVLFDDDVPEWIYSESLILDRAAPTATWERGRRALTHIREAKADSPLGRLRAIGWGEAPLERDDIHVAHWFDASLNEAQKRAVGIALSAHDIALIHGPPGTGKTRTLVEVVRQAHQRGERILITAASNAAIDNLAERLVNVRIPVLRLGHPARVASALEASTLDAALDRSGERRLTRQWMQEAAAIRRKVEQRRARGQLSHAERRAMQRDARTLTLDARHHLRRVQAAIIANTRVVCATAAGATEVLLGEDAFDRVVLDEATQATDPVALVALARAPKAVLAGDPCQLPPTVISPDAARAGLSRTLFERLAARDNTSACRQMLKVQHRMHAALMAFPSREMYDGRLIAAEHVADRTLTDLGVHPDPERPSPLSVVDTAGKGFDDLRTGHDGSTENPEQAERTAAEVRRLLSRGLSPMDVGLITPYAAQVRRLRGLLAPEVEAGLEVSSVDGFQGREKPVIVLDLVRSNADAHVGFLADIRRMNVAITRAQRFLLVVGDSATVGTHPFYARFFEHAEATGAYVSAWTDDAPPLDLD